MLARWRQRWRLRRQRRERIDPFAVGEPWRHHVKRVLQAQGRFQRVVDEVADGPLRMRLEEIGRDVEQGTRECWRIAQRGDALADAVSAVSASVTGSTGAGVDDLVAASQDAQLATVERLRARAGQADRELAVLCGRLDQAVATVVELSVGVAASDTDQLGREVDGVIAGVVDELVALREAVDETLALGQ
ncbi:hypothetical protein BH20ACT1_BH20ACT1_07180 [soil metagenome]